MLCRSVATLQGLINKLGPLSFLVSTVNDPSFKNVTTSALAATEAGEGLVVPSLTVDFMEAINPTGPAENMPMDFSIPTEPEQTTIGVYDGELESW